MKYLFTLVLSCLSLLAFSTHNRAGEITYRHVSGLTYEFTITTYTFTQSPADRDNLTINWGDNTQSLLPRVSRTVLPNYIQRNVYVGQHTYNGNGTFTISMEDPNRNGGIINILNSVNVPFYIETELVINPFYHTNSSPVLLNPPIDNGCIGYPFLHNPSAFDADGDSLSYELVACKEQGGQDIPSYTFPQASNSFSIDPVTGTVTWDSPVLSGEYNIAIKITEWRDGVKLGSVLRDMQVLIAACNNNPPEIRAINDTCVEVGQELKFEVYASDINNDNLELTATGGPFVLSPSPALFPGPVSGPAPVADTFRWTPVCDHVRKQSYQVDFKARDDGSPVNLVDLESVLIRVIAPAPKNLTATARGISIDLEWNQSFCSNAERYDIYRHNGYINYQPANCETGVPAWTGYVKVGSTSSLLDTTFTDNNNGYGLIQGIDYCYMVVAVFPDGAESYPSLEACASLVKDVPVITHVTVDTTDVSDGELSVTWAKPTVIDPTIAPGPYIYHIYHSDQANGQNMVLVDSVMSLQDTTYTLVDQNTLDLEHWFKITLINVTPGNRFVMGPSQLASSVFIETAGFDNRVQLTWNESVPWTNDTFIVYRENAAGIFDSIGFTTTRAYTDSNLVNGKEYCYKIKSIGRYSAPGFVDPIINYSQENCGSPIDQEPPCTPILTVNADCERIENEVFWTLPDPECIDDISRFTLYYKGPLDVDFSEIFSTSDPSVRSFIHTGMSTIAGCYSIVAVDSFMNVSAASPEFCIDIDSCERYRLPNVFTPNDDGYNDLLRPFPYDFVERVDLKIYNRWGVLVFQTEDPEVLWDGRELNTHRPCSDGVYFYVCDVFELRLEGVVKREIHGTVTIIGVNNK